MKIILMAALGLLLLAVGWLAGYLNALLIMQGGDWWEGEEEEL